LHKINETLYDYRITYKMCIDLYGARYHKSENECQIKVSLCIYQIHVYIFQSPPKKEMLTIFDDDENKAECCSIEMYKIYD